MKTPEQIAQEFKDGYLNRVLKEFGWIPKEAVNVAAAIEVTAKQAIEIDHDIDTSEWGWTQAQKENLMKQVRDWRE